MRAYRDLQAEKKIKGMWTKVLESTHQQRALKRYKQALAIYALKRETMQNNYVLKK